MDLYELRATIIRAFAELHSKVYQDRRLYKQVDWDKFKENIAAVDEFLKDLLKKEHSFKNAKP